MPARLQQQLQELRDHLAQQPPMSDAERDELAALLQQLEQQQGGAGNSSENASLIDGVNLAVERFESEHPTLAGTLRDILQSLANMGI